VPRAPYSIAYPTQEYEVREIDVPQTDYLKVPMYGNNV